MRPSPIRYYHGTNSLSAVRDMASGGALRPSRPEGRSAFSKSAGGFVYLTPCFRLAADYAMMRDRRDWPAEHDVVSADLPHVFGFDLSSVALAIPEEDELGRAAMVAVTGGRKRSPCTMNILLLNTLREDRNTLADLAAEAGRIIGGTARYRALADGRSLTMAEQTAVGRRMAEMLDPELGERLMAMGMSVGVRESVVPVAAWTLEIGARPGVAMDHPDKADPLCGPWDQDRNLAP
ncbi:MAG: hypothetical protein ACRYGG_17010 [Janthinobacterium lividum]